MHCSLTTLFVVAASAAAQSPVWIHRDAALNGTGVRHERTGRIVTFDAFGEVYDYERSGRQLQRPVSGPRPAGRAGQAMAYDARRDRIVMFGGTDPLAGTFLGDTWFWDGTSWSLSTTAPAPPASSGAMMCYDSVRDRIVLFGGGNGATWLTDTWEHDGVRWIARTPSTVPASGPSALCFDSNRGVTVLIVQDSALSTATYEWDGVDWTLVASAGPAQTSGMVFDASRNRTVLVGGNLAHDEVWEWDGSQWLRTGTGIAPARRGAIVADDPAGGVTVLGGLDVISNAGSTRSGATHSDRWEWDGAVMNPVHGDLVPPARAGASWAADAATGTAILFGGSDAAADRNDTWEWDGSTWSRAIGSTAPAPRWGAATAEQPSGAGVVLFGGVSDSSGPTVYFGDTWTWSLGAWALSPPGTTAPSPRAGAAMATDLAAGTTLLFGGATGPSAQPGSFDDETWSWNGSAWQQLAPAASPPGRSGAAMCWYPTTATTYLFGGISDSFRLNDFWAFDGSTWQQLTPAAAPPALADPDLVFDFGSGSVVLTGLLPAPANELQTWSWTGTTWQLVDSVPAINAGYGGTVMTPRTVFHGRNGQLATYDGFGVRMRTAQPALVDSLGGGCGAPAPRLSGRTWPIAGEPEFGLDAAVATANAPVVFAIGDTAQNLLIAPGCRVIVGGQIGVLLGIANPAGIATIDVPIPFSASLLGGVAIAQAGVLSPFATGVLDLSNGLQITVGF